MSGLGGATHAVTSKASSCGASPSSWVTGTVDTRIAMVLSISSWSSAQSTAKRTLPCEVSMSPASTGARNASVSTSGTQRYCPSAGSLWL